MITHIKGILKKKTLTSAIIATASGIGFEVMTPYHGLELPGNRAEVELYTYLQVKEDGMSLFGFLTEAELEMFKLLITVNGVGPKSALGILSNIPHDDLRIAIATEDTKTISKAPGVGNKMAAKLVLELRDKLGTISAGNDISLGTVSRTLQEDAIDALVSLGYSATDAAKAVRSIPEVEWMSLEDIIKYALKNI